MDLHSGEGADILDCMQKLLPKSKFAKLAGVNPSTVTRLSETVLKDAVAGKQIDAAHPAAVAYLENRENAATPPPASGPDPLYDEAVRACNMEGTFTQSFLRRTLRIGSDRAAKIFKIMELNGEIPDKKGPPPEPARHEPAPLRGRAVTKEAKKHAPAPAPESTLEIPEDIEAFVDFSLRELIEKFGTDARFVDWLKATKEIEMINEKRLKNAQTQGTLVSRELMKVGVIEPIDAAHIKLLTDGAKTIARRATAMHDAGRELDEIENFVKDQITSFIRPVKTKVKRALADA